MTDPWVEAAQNWYNLAYYQVVDGFTPIEVDGQTGWGTMYAFTRALQYELGISPRSDTFGPGTLTALSTFGTVNSSNPPASGKTNVIRIAQAALYCKGYNPGNGAITGVWDTATQNAVKAMRSDLGLGATSSDLTPKLFKFLLTMDAAKLLPGGDSVVRQGQQAMNARYLSRRDFYAVPADGYFLRDTHRALLFALQYEIGMADGTANGNFGPGTKSGLQTQANLGIGATNGSKFFV
jgi:peptidoglycan hydrolase-like protein with peptidoglycan-binding domain